MSRIIRSTYGIDKIAIRVDADVCNTEFKGLYKLEGKLNGEEVYDVPGVNGINIINKGQFYYIMYHDCLFTDHDKLLIDTVYEGLVSLHLCKYPFIKIPPNNNFLEKHCCLAELEIFYDFYNYNPIKWINSESFNVVDETTYYTKDFRVDRNMYDEVRETFPSIGIIYNKGKQIRSDEERYRIEFRFKKRRYLKDLGMIDLFNSFNYLYYQKMFKKVVFYTKKFFSESEIQFEYWKMRQYSSSFFNVLLDINTKRKYKKRTGAY